MKTFLLSIVFILTGTAVFAQQASDYFPQQTGYRWDYKVVPLDSANNEIDSLTYFRVDSFAVNTNFLGRNADVVLSKTGPYQLINYLPYTDSSFFSFENSDGYQYFRISNLNTIIAILDSIGIDSTVLGVIHSFEDWYSVFRFAQPVGSEYTIFTKDTTVTIDSTDLPLRFEYLGKRLDDETIQTETGTYLCKKFLLSTVVSYIVFPGFTWEIIRLETTKWISENVWMVQEISPTKIVDLGYIGYGTYVIPGSKTVLIPLITDVNSAEPLPSAFELSQNYPNPFNPSTTIKYDLPKESRVKIDIYDILGREVATLVNDIKKAGSYRIIWNANRFASGVYLYRLQAGDYHEVRKLLLLK